jgi:DNA polymerase III alpha subunit
MLTNKEKDLITGILTHGPDVLANAYTKDISENIQKYVDRVVSEKLNYPMPLVDIPTTRNWFIPNEYKKIDVRDWLLSKCSTQQQIDRVELELKLFEKNNMLDILPVMIYVVNTLRAQNIVWGVGRGSSVSCYCLYLIGIHKIDSLKYDLPINEFFKGEI